MIWIIEKLRNGFLLVGITSSIKFKKNWPPFWEPNSAV